MDWDIDENYYHFIFENSLDAILLTTPDGKIFRANQAACEMFQRTEEEICKLDRSMLVDINDPRLHSALSEREYHGFVRAEINFIKKDGSIFPTDCASALFEDKNGKIWATNIIRDISIKKEEEEKLRKLQEDTMRLASFDDLTGILNRRVFLERLRQEKSRAKRDKTMFSLLLIDIDSFKQINHKIGHKGGDYILQQFARHITKNLRIYDILARYGGDEFIICLPNTKYEEAYRIAERIRSHIEHQLFVYNSQTISVTASIGIECCNYLSEEEPDDLISKVDDNMYRAKSQRNYVFGLKN